MKFYIVRHGTKEHIPFDPPLTKYGRKQAEQTAKSLQNIRFHKIITSPKRRTQETANIINSVLKVPIHVDDRFQERLEWEHNETFEDFIKEWNKTDFNRTYQPTHGRSSKNHGKVATSVLEEQVLISDSNVLIVTHGGTIGDILRELFSEKEIVHVLSPDGAPYVDIQECSLTIFEKSQFGYTLLTVGDTSHLKDV